MLFSLEVHISNNIRSNNSSQSTAQLIANSRAAAIEQYQKQFCGINSIPHANDYITEYKLPATCEMPLGILVDGQAGKVWYVSTKQGTLGSYDIALTNLIKNLIFPYGMYEAFLQTILRYGL